MRLETVARPRQQLLGVNEWPHESETSDAFVKPPTGDTDGTGDQEVRDGITCRDLKLAL